MKTRNIKGESYTLVVFKILGRDALGRPKNLQLFHDDEVDHLKGGEEYMTGFVLSKMVEKRTVS